MKKSIPGQKNSFSSRILIRLLIFVISWLALVTVAIYDKELVRPWMESYHEGEPSAKDVYSPYSFTYVNELETELKRKYEQDKVRDIFRKQTDYADAASAEIARLFELSKQAAGDETITVESVVEGTVLQIDAAFAKEMGEVDDPDGLLMIIQESLASYFNAGILSLAQKIDLFKGGKTTITIYGSDGSITVPVGSIMTINEELAKIDGKAQKLFPRDRKKRDIYIAIVKKTLKPNLIFDPVLTQELKEQVYKETQPVYDRVVKGEVMLRKGQLVTGNDLIRLTEIEELRAKREIVFLIVGVAVIIFVALILLFTILYLFEYQIFSQYKNLIVINVIIFSVFILSKGIISVPISPTPLPITALAPVLMAILFTPRSALIIAVVQAVLTATITDFNPLFLILGLGAGIMALYPTIGIRRRSQFFRISIYVAIINFFASHGYYVLTGADMYESFTAAVYGLLNGLLLIPPFLFIGIWLFEHVFDITTDISLLELSDLNHPLLRRLVIEAPGTYHHSLVVSNLAENACDSIGANSLLARVGCYYHDIGKIEKAEYFTENQTSKDQNIHDKLTPSMSCMFITNHVKDGIDLGKKYKIKEVILDFIMQHHGKSLVYFFYQKALREQEENGETETTEVNLPINSTEFRYPGPKPQTKESAVAMLADSVEAASRTLTNPTADSITELVSKVVNDKFMDNQLDECELTFNDLRKIQRAFVRNLMAIYHTRIEYPAIKAASKDGKIT
ncbi:HD family phosphohydrolase [Candidatus Omnitrophota bacterium]